MKKDKRGLLIVVWLLLTVSGWLGLIFLYRRSSGMESRLKAELLREIGDDLALQSSIRREVEKSKEEKFFLTQLQLNTQLDELKQEFRRNIADQLSASRDSHEQTLSMLDTFSRQTQAERAKLEQERLLAEESFKAREGDLLSRMEGLEQELASLTEGQRSVQNRLEKTASDLKEFTVHYEEQRLSRDEELASQVKNLRSRIRQLEETVSSFKEPDEQSNPQPQP